MPYREKSDQASYAKKHYEDNKQVYVDRAQAHRKALRDRLQPMVRNLKETTPCSDCDKIYPYWVMQFDHRPGTVKKFDIAKVSKWTSEKVLLEEIAKCDIVCANCHATRTYTRQKGVFLVEYEAFEDYLAGNREHPGYLGFDTTE